MKLVTTTTTTETTTIISDQQQRQRQQQQPPRRDELEVTLADATQEIGFQPEVEVKLEVDFRTEIEFQHCRQQQPWPDKLVATSADVAAETEFKPEVEFRHHQQDDYGSDAQRCLAATVMLQVIGCDGNDNAATLVDLSALSADETSDVAVTSPTCDASDSRLDYRTSDVPNNIAIDDERDLNSTAEATDPFVMTLENTASHVAANVSVDNKLSKMEIFRDVNSERTLVRDPNASEVENRPHHDVAGANFQSRDGVFDNNAPAATDNEIGQVAHTLRYDVNTDDERGRRELEDSALPKTEMAEDHHELIQLGAVASSAVEFHPEVVFDESRPQVIKVLVWGNDDLELSADHMGAEKNGEDTERKWESSTSETVSACDDDTLSQHVHAQGQCRDASDLHTASAQQLNALVLKSADDVERINNSLSENVDAGVYVTRLGESMTEVFRLEHGSSVLAKLPTYASDNSALTVESVPTVTLTGEELSDVEYIGDVIREIALEQDPITTVQDIADHATAAISVQSAGEVFIDYMLSAECLEESNESVLVVHTEGRDASSHIGVDKATEKVRAKIDRVVSLETVYTSSEATESVPDQAVVEDIDVGNVFNMKYAGVEVEDQSGVIANLPQVQLNQPLVENYSLPLPQEYQQNSVPSQPDDVIHDVNSTCATSDRVDTKSRLGDTVPTTFVSTLDIDCGDEVILLPVGQRHVTSLVVLELAQESNDLGQAINTGGDSKMHIVEQVLEQARPVDLPLKLDNADDVSTVGSNDFAPNSTTADRCKEICLHLYDDSHLTHLAHFGPDSMSGQAEFYVDRWHMGESDGAEEVCSIGGNYAGNATNSLFDDAVFVRDECGSGKTPTLVLSEEQECGVNPETGITEQLLIGSNMSLSADDSVAVVKPESEQSVSQAQCDNHQSDHERLVLHQYGEMWSVFREIPLWVEVLRAEVIERHNSDPRISRLLARYPSLRPGTWVWTRPPLVTELRRRSRQDYDGDDVAEPRGTTSEQLSVCQCWCFTVHPVIEQCKLVTD